MGNSSSSGSRHQDDTVDYGALVPQGVYTGPRDWNQAIVSQLIAQRKMAPFYRPLEDYEDAWDDDQILAARKEFPDPSLEQTDAGSRIDQGSSASSFHGSSKSSHSKRPSSAKEFRPDAAIYRGAVECPICFLVRKLLLNCMMLTIYVISAVLPSQYQSLSMLRPSHLHRMFRANQTGRAYNDPSCFGTRGMSLLCSGRLRDRL